MSILNEGRYKGNLAWIGQLLHNDGFDAVARWMQEIPQHDKEDVRFMMELLAKEIATLSRPDMSANDPFVPKKKPEIPGIKGLKEKEKIIRMKPKLRLVDSKFDPKKGK